MKKLAVLMLLFATFASLAVYAQQATPEGTAKISKYVWIEDAHTMPGKYMAFRNSMLTFKQTADTMNSDVYWLAGTNMTGDMNRVTFVTFHDTMASVEKTAEALDGINATAMKNASYGTESTESDAGATLMLAKYREDISYNPTKVDVGHMKAWAVTVLQLKPGTMADLNELAKEEIAMMKKANVDDHWIAYEIMGGMPGPAVMFVTPMKSLADIDEDKTEEAMKTVITPWIHKQFGNMVKNIVTAEYTNYLAVNPTYSRMPQSVVAANPEFWNVKAAPEMAKAPAKKGKQKVEPATMQEKPKQ
jgi:hypothetical protein